MAKPAVVQRMAMEVYLRMARQILGKREGALYDVSRITDGEPGKLVDGEWTPGVGDVSYNSLFRKYIRSSRN
jgi:hypothetical protein